MIKIGRRETSKILKLCSGIVGAVLGGLYGRYIPFLFIFEPPPEGRPFSVLGAIIGFIVLYYVIWMPYSPLQPDQWLGKWLHAKLKAKVTHRFSKKNAKQGNSFNHNTLGLDDEQEKYKMNRSEQKKA